MPRCTADADLIAGHLPASRRGTILDVGCGSGDILGGLVRLGWKGAGIDPDPDAVAAGRANGLNIESGGFQDEVFDRETFDAVISVHVIEHVADPAAFIKSLRSKVRPDGTVVVVTPNLGSAQFRRRGRHWLHLDPPRHLLLMHREALEALFASEGFDVESCVTVCRGANVNWRGSRDIAIKGRHDMTASPSMHTRILAECALIRCAWRVRRHPDEGEEIVVVARPRTHQPE